jgi:hypothetical protein
MKYKPILKYSALIFTIVLTFSIAFAGCRIASAGENIQEAYEGKQDVSYDDLKERAYHSAAQVVTGEYPGSEPIVDYSPDKVVEESPGVYVVTVEGRDGTVYHCVLQYFEDGDMFDAIELVREKGEPGSEEEYIAGQEPQEDLEETSENNIKGGMLSEDETWTGDIFVTESITVPEGVTLTIEPGTRVMFKHYRGYKEPEKKLGLEVNGGTLLALGKPDRQIWFTSDAEEPINGDWWEIFLRETTTSKLDYVIVEFSQLGISQFNSKVPITNSIVRWTNSEGLYAEQSSPVFENNTLYENGYHEIALEHYNRDVVIRNNILKNGRVAIHTEETHSLIENNYFYGYDMEVISICADSEAIIKNNKFENIENKEVAIITEAESTAEVEGNDFGQGDLKIPVFDYQDIKDNKLGYLPGDPEDKYLYVYESEDETRRVVKRIGEGLGFGWSLFYADGYLWTFSFAENPGFVRLDPSTGETKIYKGNGDMINGRGLVFDGQYFWANDFCRLKIFKFTLDGDSLKILESFDVPEKENGGAMGLAYDGEHILYHSRDGMRLYKIDKEGKVVEKVDFKDDEKHMGIPGTFVWTGEYYWISVYDKLIKLTEDGEIVGEIYGVADGAFAVAWDGKYLWTVQRTCEMWDDAKIFQIEVLDDSL